MAALQPLFVDDRTAAKLFCLSRAEFLDLIRQGHLPAPTKLGTYDRWDVEELLRIAKGERARPDEGLEL
ncbi:helix-turn-helix transcriptional regulator [Pseudooceanicola spongiae]|uniref:Helix-turn-helix domain-containing protein n=1 Tax=Pseudooceanicola spongiae TaxID=2613965 RepID=A0A7L9WL86_9RHOB|nr:hypothetical protein [Pseudooceanicola spongiae]QOL80457.1 hypothetical protein F3W81_06305 [Pseudooceanicola spongiae]